MNSRASSRRPMTITSRCRRLSSSRTRTIDAAARRSSCRTWRKFPRRRIGEKLPLHLDGARIFNAALALETTPKEIASDADTRVVLPVEGTWMPSRIAAMREPRIYRARASHAQNARRRNAASGNNCGGGNRRADHDGRSAGRGSSECARAGAGIRVGRGTQRARGQAIAPTWSCSTLMATRTRRGVSPRR